jgi:hypothetical protein
MGPFDPFPIKVQKGRYTAGYEAGTWHDLRGVLKRPVHGSYSNSSDVGVEAGAVDMCQTCWYFLFKG